MKVSFLNGVMVEKDAISNSLRDKVRALSEWSSENGTPLESRIYLYGTDSKDARIRIVRYVNDVLSDPHFMSSDLVVYDFGIYYETFNTIYLAPKTARKVVHFHNITPPEFAPEPDREAVARAYEQLANVFEADLVVAGSVFNKKTLIDFGVEEKRIAVLDYVAEFGSGGVTKPEGALNLLYIGRFVPSKGVLDLLKAFKTALDRGALNMRLKLAGNEYFSDKAYLAEVKRFISESGLSHAVSFAGTVSEEEKAALYAEAHALVMPSYHEGFCVPVIEAFHHGCFVIAYGSGNLPNTVNGLGSIVPTGDIDALSERIFEYYKRKSGMPPSVPADRGEMAEDAFIKLALEYSGSFSFARFKERLADVLGLNKMLPL